MHFHQVCCLKPSWSFQIPREHVTTSRNMQEWYCFILMCVSISDCSLLVSSVMTILICHVITWSKVMSSVGWVYLIVPAKFGSHVLSFLKLWYDNIENCITKWDSYYAVIQKTVIKKLLQNATEVYYKVHQILRSVTIITKWDLKTFRKRNRL